MLRYEYKIVPAPRRGEKAKGVKTTPDRFAYALAQLMNQLGQDGWEYQRADTLPCDERVGLTGTKTTFQSLLVFRRALPEVAEAAPPAPAPAMTATPPEPVTVPALGAAEAPAGSAPPVGPANQQGMAAE